MKTVEIKLLQSTVFLV